VLARLTADLRRAHTDLLCVLSKTHPRASTAGSHPWNSLVCALVGLSSKPYDRLWYRLLGVVDRAGAGRPPMNQGRVQRSRLLGRRSECEALDRLLTDAFAGR